MVGGIPLNLARDIICEVVRQATDDAPDRGKIPGGQATDGEHNTIVRRWRSGGGVATIPQAQAVQFRPASPHAWMLSARRLRLERPGRSLMNVSNGRMVRLGGSW
jgi:hypothetical protein